MDNRRQYGFRPYRCRTGDTPPYERGLIVTAQSFDVNGGAANVQLRAGDPVRETDTGFVLCDGSEGSGGCLAASHIVAGIGWQWDATLGFMTFKKGMSSDIAYGTNLSREGRIIVIPVESCVWEIDCDENDSYTTEATYRALGHSNVNHVLCGQTGERWANPRLDISTAATTNTLIWRIRGISPTRENRDFSGEYVKLLVEANLADRPAFGGTTGD